MPIERIPSEHKYACEVVILRHQLQEEKQKTEMLHQKMLNKINSQYDELVAFRDVFTEMLEESAHKLDFLKSELSRTHDNIESLEKPRTRRGYRRPSAFDVFQKFIKELWMKFISHAQSS